MDRRLRNTVLLTALVAGALTVFADLHAGAASIRRDQFACYPTQFSTFRPRRITISDAVVPKLTVIVRRPVDVCAPARVDAVRAASVSTYLTCHEISAPRVSRRSPGRISTAVGSATLVVEEARSSCISSSRTATTPQSLRLTCYGVLEPATGEERVSTIGDTFGTSPDRVSVGRPVLFCTESRRGSPTALHLVCYPVVSKTLGQTVVLTTAWGLLRGSPGVRDRLCVRSSLTR
jgi:hypothetical protein